MINKENKIFLEIIDDIKKSNEQRISYDEEFQLKKFAYIVNNKEEFEKLGYEIKIVDSVFGYDTVSLKKIKNNMKIMTVRELVQKILEEAPDLDADVYISKAINEIESKSYKIKSIEEAGNDGLYIQLKDWE